MSLINAQFMVDLRSRLAELLRFSDRDDTVAAITPLGQLIDICSELGDGDALQAAIAWAERIESSPIMPEKRLELSLYVGNAWLEAYAQATRASRRDASDWLQPELESAVLNLRRVVSSPTFESWHAVRRAQTYTNLGNTLGTLGRSIDAIQMRDVASMLVPRFGMALGTRAESLLALGGMLVNKADRYTYVAAAAAGFAAALSPDAFYETTGYDQVRLKWDQRRNELEEFCSKHTSEILSFEEHGPDSTDPPSSYSQWCLKERLRLNPLNDLGSILSAGHDSVHLPPMAPHDARAELLFGLFDSIAQEYIAARRLAFEAISEELPYESELHNVHDTGDDPVYGLAAEKLKLSYRSLYSIFDKIAHFLRIYYAIEIKARNVSFARIWYERTEKLRPEFIGSRNRPLRGLYWVSRDLSDALFAQAIEPDSEAFATIRQYLEHRYLRIIKEPRAIIVGDDLLTISISDLKLNTVRLLRLVRTAILTLVNAIAVEEREQGRTLSLHVVMPSLIATQLRTSSDK